MNINGTTVYERLYRGISHSSEQQIFSDNYILNEVFSCSNHAPIIYQSRSFQPPIPCRFRFYNAWTHDSEVKKIVHKYWHSFIGGSKFYTICHKLRRIKSDLKSWHSRTYGNTHKKLAENGDKLKNLESQLLQFSHNNHMEQHMHRLKKQKERLLAFSRQYWGKCARKKVVNTRRP